MLPRLPRLPSIGAKDLPWGTERQAPETGFPAKYCRKLDTRKILLKVNLLIPSIAVKKNRVKLKLKLMKVGMFQELSLWTQLPQSLVDTIMS